jgi:hypothetical protein
VAQTLTDQRERPPSERHPRDRASERCSSNLQLNARLPFPSLGDEASDCLSLTFGERLPESLRGHT